MMKAFVLFSFVFFLVVVPSSAATLTAICARYAPTFAPNASEPEATFMQAVINETLSNLFTDPTTENWFNGVNNAPHKNFTNSSYAADLNNMRNGFIAFFGNALGCNSSSFKAGAVYDIAQVNQTMAQVHAVATSSTPGGFQQPVTGQAFSRFNQLFTSILRTLVLMNDSDVYAVSMFLDQYRGTYTGYPAKDQICNDNSSCSQEFIVQVNSSGFSPNYIRAVVNQAVRLDIPSKYSTNLLESAALASCQAAGTYDDPVSGPSNDIAFVGDLSFGSQYFFDNTTCHWIQVVGANAQGVSHAQRSVSASFLSPLFSRFFSY